MLILKEKRIDERLLHYLWLKGTALPYEFHTNRNTKIRVLSSGAPNPSRGGADFIKATLEINGIKIHGNIEIHLHSKDWYRHKHHLDKNYNSCILHVVLFSDGTEILREDGTEIPEISLSPYINAESLRQYENFFLGKDILCSRWKNRIPERVLNETLRQAFRLRIRKRTQFLHSLLRSSRGDWQQTAWQFLMFFAGSPYNKEAFLLIASQLPYKLLQIYSENPLYQEALLLGTARRIPPSPKTEHAKKLLEIFQFLQQKHSLQIPDSVCFQHNGRMFNAPDFALIRTLYLIRNFGNVLAMFEELSPKMTFLLPQYWETHLVLNKKTSRKIRQHKAFVQKLFINAVLPFRFYRKQYEKEKISPEKLAEFYAQVPAENHRITRLIRQKTAFPLRSSYETQAATELYKSYCSLKNCLKCPAGNYLLREIQNPKEERR